MPNALNRFIAVCALIPLTFVMLVAAIAIKLDSAGPIIFRQTRVGLHGKTFTIHKFRTMTLNTGKNISTNNDARITRVGKILRKTKLDELPQLFDVARGKMNFVGPRPEVPEYAAQWPTELYPLIVSIPPGITDPASIKYRNEADILSKQANPEEYYVSVILPDKAKIYAQYVQERSFIGDIKIIFQTIAEVVGK